MVEVSKTDAIEAVRMCLEVVKGFVDDAEILRQSGKYERLWTQYQLAFEELGKANAMLTPLENGGESIQMNNEIRTKHRIQMNHIKSLVRLPPDTKEKYKEVWKDFPMSPDGSVFEGEAGKLQRQLWDGIFDKASEGFVKIDETYLNHFLTEGDKLRKDCRVNFKNNGKPYKAEPMGNGEINVIVPIINELVKKFRSRLDNLI